MARRKRCPVRKRGRYGTLYKYKIPYKDRAHSDGYGIYEGTWHTFAYDAEHALENFYEGPDAEGWIHKVWPKRVMKPC